MAKLTEDDYSLLTEFIGSVLGRYKADKMEGMDAIGTIAYLVSIVDRGGEVEPRDFMLHIIDEGAR